MRTSLPDSLSARPPHSGMWCECTLACPVHSRTWLLAGYRAPSPRLAARWLRWQARRLADLIDPPRDVPWAPAGVLSRAEDSGGTADPAADLRGWLDDADAYNQALHALSDGCLYTFTTGDDSLRYGLSARPILTAVPCVLEPGAGGGDGG